MVLFTASIRRWGMAFLALVLVLPARAQEAEKKRLLRILRSYSHLPSFASQFEAQVEREEGVKVSRWTVKGEIAFSSPNRFLLRMEDPIGGFVVACDGKKVISYIWPHKQYRIDPAPKSLKEFKADPFLGLPGRGPLVWKLLCAKKPEEIGGDIKTVEFVKATGEVEVLKATVANEKVHASGVFTFWIGRRDQLIRRVVMCLDYRPPKGEEVRYTIREEYANPRKGIEIPDQKFEFKPPERSVRVTSFSPP